MAFITLSKAHLFHNLELLCTKAGGKERIMAVLKDNAYGHGLLEIASLIHEFGIRKVAVKNILEARKIASWFDEVLVLVDYPTSELLPPTISLAIPSYEALIACQDGATIHLAIDSGMHRNGIQEAQLEKALECILLKKLHVKGVFTHFRSSDELSSEFFWQKSVFARFKERIQAFVEANNLPKIAFHSSNSSALLRRESLGDEAYARCGISLYGYTTLHPLLGTYDLKPILALWAQKLSTRTLKKGERVGYGGMYEAKEDELISTYDVGYGDGFFRFDGEIPVQMADAKRSKGRMSMDSFCLGGNADVVCMFDDANGLAKHFNTISYEIITKLSPFLERKIID